MSQSIQGGITRQILHLGALGCFGMPLFAQDILFSIDYHGPTIGTPDSVFGSPITEGDILGATPKLGPLGTPGLVYAAGPGPTLNHLALSWYPVTVGHPPGVMGFVEVDAFSLGQDPEISSDLVLSPGTIFFSVDEFAAGVAASPLLPEIASESPFGDSSADLFTNRRVIPVPLPTPPLFFGSHLGVVDGNGMPSGSGFSYPGLGLIEPNSPQGAPPDFGDNLDALELVHEDWNALFFSLDSLYTDPHPLMGGLTNSGSAFAHGFVGSDVLMTLPGAAAPVLFASSAALGLAGIPGKDPDHNDLDALVLRENGNLVFDPPQFPGHWVGGATDMILFSVRRGSMVIGAMDSLRGMPIEEGDLLMPPISPAFGGLSPNPGIYVPAEMLGLATIRSGTVSNGPPSMGFADDLNALDIRLLQAHPLLAAQYCHCPPPGICGNPDSLAGCGNSTGVGGHLTASGSSSVVADDLVLTTNQLPANKFGLMFMGPGQIVFPFGDGLRCVGGGIIRLPINNSGAAGQIVEGPGIAGASGGLIAAGSILNFQTWYRDPTGPCGNGFNLSNGLVVEFLP